MFGTRRRFGALFSLSGFGREVFLEFALLAFVLVGIGGRLLGLVRNGRPYRRKVAIEREPFLKTLVAVCFDSAGRAGSPASAAIARTISVFQPFTHTTCFKVCTTSTKSR